MAGNLNNGFLLLYDWVPAIQSLPGDDAKALLLALIERQKNRTPLPNFDNNLAAVFAQMIEPTIQRRLDGQAGGIKANEDTTVGTTQDTNKASKEKKSKNKQREDIAEQSQNTAKHILSNESTTPPIPSKGADERFEKFWKAYPKHQGKQAALKAFQKLKPSDELLQTMLTALDVQKHSEQWAKENGKFIPLPATWLNGKRWEDELTAIPFNDESVDDWISSL